MDAVQSCPPSCPEGICNGAGETLSIRNQEVVVMDVVRFWDRLAPGYDAQAGGKYANAYADAVALARGYLRPTDRVLDFACGTGLVTLALADAAASFFGVDISPNMIGLARAKCEARGVSNAGFSVGTLFDDSLAESSFDAVLAFNILHGLPDAPAHCARIHRLLKPGGLFLSVTDCLKDAGRPAVALIKSLVFLRLMPCVSILSPQAVIRLVETARFDILRVEKLFEKPPNLFIAARRA
jgi:ubiquinone/menaquinone biosynthesis C-methylase UbiE